MLHKLIKEIQTEISKLPEPNVLLSERILNLNRHPKAIYTQLINNPDTIDTIETDQFLSTVSLLENIRETLSVFNMYNNNNKLDVNLYMSYGEDRDNDKLIKTINNITDFIKRDGVSINTEVLEWLREQKPDDEQNETLLNVFYGDW